MTEPTKLKKPLVFKLKTTISDVKDIKLPYYGQQIPVWNESGECMINNTKTYLPHHKDFKNEQLESFYKKYNHNPEHGFDDLNSKIKSDWEKGPNGKQSAPNVAQEFVKYYMRPENIVKGVLLYHNLGSGKTRTAIETVKQYIPYGITPLVILPASLNQTWKLELAKWDNENISKYEFISYNASNSPEKIAEGLAKNTAIDDISSLEISKGKKYFVIIDEAHNFMSSLTNANTKRASLYSTFMKFSGKIMCLTATPTINKPFELALFFNILKGYLDDSKNTLFPENELDFKQLYSDKPKNRAFMYRINGMVSYYVGNLMSGEYPEKIIHPPELIQMTDNQLAYYNQVRRTEEEVERFSFTDDIQQSYRSASRMASNFVFPVARPKPRDYLGDTFANYKPTLSYTGKWNQTQIDTLKKILTPDQYTKFEEFYRNGDISIGEKLDYLQSLYSSNPDGINTIYNQEDIQSYSVFNTKRNFGSVSSYNDAKQLLRETIRAYPNFIKPAEGQDPDTITTSQLIKYSSKYQRIFDNIISGPGSKGLVFVYSAFKELEGLTMFSFVLEYSSYKYTNMTADVATTLSGIIDTDEETIGDMNLYANRYLIYSGDISPEQRNIIKKIFTHPKNSHGQICKIFLGTAAAAEGLDLKCIQQVHIMEPHWNYVRIQQVIGRAVRFRSHISLPENERKVHVFQYLSVDSETEKLDSVFSKGESTDLYLYKLAYQKNTTNDKFLGNVKNSAIDCDVLKHHNNIPGNETMSVTCNNMAVSDNILFKKNGAEDMDDEDFVNETSVLSTKYYKSIIKYGNISQTVYYLLDSGVVGTEPHYSGQSLCWKLRPTETKNETETEINKLNCTDKWQHLHLFEPKSYKMIKTDKVRITCEHSDTGIVTRYEKYDSNVHFHNN